MMLYHISATSTTRFREWASSRHAMRAMSIVMSIGCLLAASLLAAPIVHAESPDAVKGGMLVSGPDAERQLNALLDKQGRPLQFAVVADRTGGHRGNVFEEALHKAGALHPDFIMSVGDLIEGYTVDESLLQTQWNEFHTFLNGLPVPFVATPGNHDISNAVMAKGWAERFRRPYYSFVRDKVLFLVLNTEDPPGGHMSTEQAAFVKNTLQKNAQVKWTFVFMHEPMWSSANPNGWSDIEKLLQERPHSIIVGHMHQYCYEERAGNAYITLSTSGGASEVRGPNYGEFDHILWVAMTDSGPEFSNVMLDGIWDSQVYTPAIQKAMEPVLTNHEISAKPILIAQPTFTGGSSAFELSNPTDYEMALQGYFRTNALIRPQPWDIDAVIPPHSSKTIDFTLSASRELNVSEAAPLEMRWHASYTIPGRPPLEKEGSYFVFVMADAIESSQLEGLPFAALADLAIPLSSAGYKKQALDVVDYFVPQAASAEQLIEIARVCTLAGLESGLSAKLGFVTQWRLAGPFPWNPQDAFRTAYINEPAVDCSQDYEFNGAKQPWRSLDTKEALGVFDLLETFGETMYATAFAHSTISASQECDAVLRLGSDDGVRVWLNHALVYEKNAIRGMALDGDTVPVHLQAGANTLLVQITQSSEGWRFCLRITEPEGKPIHFTYAEQQAAE